jgi:hypothetical protein
MVAQTNNHMTTINTVPSGGCACGAGGQTDRGFCANCGSPVTATSDPVPQIVGIRTANLDDSSGFNQQMDVWTCDAQPWDNMDPALPKLQKYPVQN